MITATVWDEDCIKGMADRVAENSVHLTVTSIPFEELFTYSGKVEDVGNNGSTIDIRSGRFALNMRFVIAELFRVTAPGCNVCIHIQQLLAYKNQHGFIGRRDFRGAMIDVFSAGGFHFKGEFAIQKNPQAMAQRLNLHCLMFATGYRNGSALAPCPNDYVLIFQKPGDIQVPVQCIRDVPVQALREREFQQCSLASEMSFADYLEKFKTMKGKKPKNAHGWLTTEEWIRDAHGIWTDIEETDVLDGARGVKESDQEKHVCPLQLEVIRRLVKLYSNPIDIQPNVCVLDPFAGIGSTPYIAIEQGRNAVGFELKESYHKAALANIKKALAARDSANVQPSLFGDKEAA
jgi:hypothetical protein